MKISLKITSEVKPLVSIVCLTFNQEEYIAQALDGFVAQRTDFPYEIIVHDDASTDGTLAIVREYQGRYPDLITIIEQSENIYSKGVRVPALVFSYAKGRFIAYCEGDDYWCDPNKIQLQAEILLSNPRCGAVFTNQNVLYQDSGILVPGSKMLRAMTVPRGDVKAVLLIDNPYTTCTSMFRAEAVMGYGDIARRLHARMDDLVLWLFIAHKYDIEYLNVVAATYRVSKHSASKTPYLAVKVRFYKSTYKIVNYFNNVYGRLVDREQLKRRYRGSVITYCLSNGYYKESMHYAKSIRQYAFCAFRVILKKVLNR